MTIHTYNVRRIRIAEESTFATDLTGTISAFDPIRFTGQPQLSVLYPRVTTGEMQQIMDASPYDVPTEQKRATITFTTNLTGQTTRGTNGVTHTQTALGMILRNWLGSQRLGQGDLVGSGSTSSTAVVSNGSRWETGASIATLRASNSRLFAKTILNKATNTLTTAPISATDIPSNGNTAYSSADYFFGPSAQNSSENKTIQVIVEGLVTTDRWLLLGGKVTQVRFNFPRGQIATASVTIQFADWKYGENASTNLTTDTAPISYDSESTNGTPLSVVDSDFWYTDSSLSASTKLNPSEVSIECNPKWVPIASTSGTNGILGWARDHVPLPVSMTFAIPYEDRTWLTLRDTYGLGNVALFTFQIGSSSTLGAMLFYIRGQVRDVQIVPVDGLTYQRVTIVGGIPIQTDTTDIADSPLTISMF